MGETSDVQARKDPRCLDDGTRRSRSSASSLRARSCWPAAWTVEEVCRQFGIAESTWARWLSQYGGMKADDAKRLKELEGENARLKKLLAEAELDKSMLKEIGGGKLLTPNRRRSAVVMLQNRFGVSERRACRWSASTGRPNGSNHPYRPTTRQQLREFLRAVREASPAVGVAASGQGAAPERLVGEQQAGPPPVARRRAPGARPRSARSGSPGSAPTSARCARSPRTPCGRSTSSSTTPSTAGR